MNISTGEGSGSLPRDVTTNLQVNQSPCDLVDQAASQDKDCSEFMLESACQQAQDGFLDQRFPRLNEDQFKQFVAFLDAPPTPNDRLYMLLTTQAPWE